MPEKTFGSPERSRAKKISLGRTIFFASQCVVLIQHALDAVRPSAQVGAVLT